MTTDQATEIKIEIRNFGNIAVNFKAESLRRDKQEAFTNRFTELFQKF